MKLHINKALTCYRQHGRATFLPLETQRDIQLHVGAGTMENKVATTILSMLAARVQSLGVSALD